MATPQQHEKLYKEARVDLAVQAYQTGQFKNPHAAATQYDIDRKTLLRRSSGIPSRRGSTAKNRLLTPNEEESLVKWILAMDKRGMPPRLATIRQMARNLLA